jgi:hypothetical protein
MHALPIMPASTGMRMTKLRRAEGITLAAADATTALRTEARAPIRQALGFLAHVSEARRSPANITKYAGETNPSLWLEDYWLTCQAGGRIVIICNLL